MLGENQMQTPKIAFLVESHRMCSSSSAISCENIGEMLSTKESHQELSLQGFYWGWSYRHPLSSMYLNSRPPEAKQVFSINDIVCINNLGTVSHSYQGMVETIPNPSFPDSSS